MPIGSIGRSLQTIARGAQAAGMPGHIARALVPTGEKDSIARVAVHSAPPTIGERIVTALPQAQTQYIRANNFNASALGALLPHMNKLSMQAQSALLAALHRHPSIVINGAKIKLEPSHEPKMLASALLKASLNKPISGRQVRIITAAPKKQR